MTKDNFIDIENDFTEEEEAVFSPKVGEAAVDHVKVMSLEELVVSQYKLGMTLKDITKHNTISYGKVYEILNRMGIKLRHGRYNTKSGDRLSRMTGKEKQRLIDDYMNDVPTDQLYAKYDINKHGVYTILDEAKVPRKHKHTTANFIQIEEEGTKYKSLPIEVKHEGDTLHINITKEKISPVDRINLSISLGE